MYQNFNLEPTLLLIRLEKLLETIQEEQDTRHNGADVVASHIMFVRLMAFQ